MDAYIDKHAECSDVCDHPGSTIPGLRSSSLIPSANGRPRTCPSDATRLCQFGHDVCQRGHSHCVGDVLRQVDLFRRSSLFMRSSTEQFKSLAIWSTMW